MTEETTGLTQEEIKKQEAARKRKEKREKQEEAKNVLRQYKNDEDSDFLDFPTEVREAIGVLVDKPVVKRSRRGAFDDIVETHFGTPGAKVTDMELFSATKMGPYEFLQKLKRYNSRVDEDNTVIVAYDEESGIFERIDK
jgi:hypothetical protein